MYEDLIIVCVLLCVGFFILYVVNYTCINNEF